MELTPFIDYFLEVMDYKWDKHVKLPELEKLLILESRAQFLKQPPELGQFIPVDKEGNPMEKPDEFNAKYYDSVDHTMKEMFLKDKYESDLEEYQKALDKVLFKGFRTHPLEAEWINFHRGIRIYYPHDDMEHYWSFVFDRDTNFKTIRFNKYKTLEDFTEFKLELTGNHLK